MNKIVQKALFRLRNELSVLSFYRKVWLRWQGAQIGTRTKLPRIEINWPHQLSLGNSCIIEPGVSFKFDGAWQVGPNIIIGDQVFLGRNCEFNICERVVIGEACMIASGCRFIDHNHGTLLSEPINIQPNIVMPIILGTDVWLGVNVVILKGVCIGSGAIVGAGAIVTKSVGEREIWAGVPARRIGVRA